MLTTLKNHKSIVMLSAALFTITVLFSGIYTFNGINAQSLEKLTINFNTLTFGPSTSNPLNQVYSLVDYQIKDLSLLGTTINGEMKVYAPNGTLIKTSAYSNGFTPTDESGTVQFRTAIPDQSLTNVLVNVTFTDLNRTQPISNTISSGVAVTP
ncbi:hypothetical protein [Candidatus Nitrosocosmicus franklandus]|uniref:Uncharacterized protein n=1 Tax=Candidatus Nitrosocosmicus franklandianus TaxID=1798806 RepID=A0A484I9E1_9ARCH|nr:hypothetical protein [Candidatus Nitrosocosmicus franklandus]VFJ13726.1 protein of unknown function [Candidatus Nitrosocosmicus franklandus]